MVSGNTKRRAGFTMVELVSAMAIFVTTIGVLGATFYVSQHGYEQLHARGETLMGARRLTDLAAADLRRAVGISVRQSDLIQFEIPDEDGDDRAEIVRYRWSQNPDNDVTRQMNDGPEVPVGRSVRRFAIDVRTGTPGAAPDREIVLREHRGYAPDRGPYTLNAFLVTDTTFPAQVLSFPQAPPGGVLTLTRVRFRARRTSPTAAGRLLVELRRAAGVSITMDPGAPLARRDLDLAHLDPIGFEWVEVAFDRTLAIADGDQLLLVFRGDAAGGCALEYDRLLSNNGPTDYTWMGWTSDGGATVRPNTWDRDEYDLKIVVYGRLVDATSLPVGMTEAVPLRTAGITVDLTDAAEDEVDREILLTGAGDL